MEYTCDDDTFLAYVKKMIDRVNKFYNVKKEDYGYIYYNPREIREGRQKMLQGKYRYVYHWFTHYTSHNFNWRITALNYNSNVINYMSMGDSPRSRGDILVGVKPMGSVDKIKEIIFNAGWTRMRMQFKIDNNAVMFTTAIPFILLVYVHFTIDIIDVNGDKLDVKYYITARTEEYYFHYTDKRNNGEPYDQIIPMVYPDMLLFADATCYPRKFRLLGPFFGM